MEISERAFVTIQKADKMAREYAPIFALIRQKRNAGESFTVMSLGEELMGKDAYHQKVFSHKDWHGNPKYVRSAEALNMTGRITAVIKALRHEGLIDERRVYDKSHPFVREIDGFYYVNGKGEKLPNTFFITAPDGNEYEVDARSLKGVTRTYGTTTETVYNSYNLYTCR